MQSPSERSSTRRAPTDLRGLHRGEVIALQRGRLVSAALETVEDVGYTRMTVAHVIGRARVSRKTFYDLFSDREHCFLAAFELSLRETRRLLVKSYEGQSNWRDGVRAALGALLELMDEEPGLARLYIIETLVGGERVLKRRARVLGELAQAIDRGRGLGATHDPPPLTAEALVGAVVAVLHARLLKRDRKPLASLRAPLMSMIVLPYLGVEAAREELVVERPQDGAVRRRRPRKRAADPLEGLKMRLTYRTIRVLTVIAEHPGASNRVIAQRSGIVDEGQASKLLTRLVRLDLVENNGAGQVAGEANEWSLTARGAQLERATRRR